ncbi:MAG: twin-arginine translocation signal domain-containing protein [Verrucomicrobia bacterium]|nr:twin-arginine translocation signal domain-containing protein [Verrucomicrobiota bacterium]
MNSIERRSFLKGSLLAAAAITIPARRFLAVSTNA